MTHHDPAPLDRIAALLESRIAPALERIADALERGGYRAETLDPRVEAVAEIRRAIRDGDLARASLLLGDFTIDHPDAPETSVLSELLAGANVAAIADRRARLSAARSASDADAVIGLRDELAPLLSFSEREAVDREVLPWLMSLLMRRMRAGTVRADVVALAARVAESFSHRQEGASIRASLPTLRRSAGLCAKCADPYTGDENACPKCLVEAPKIAELPESPVPPT